MLWVPALGVKAFPSKAFHTGWSCCMSYSPSPKTPKISPLFALVPEVFEFKLRMLTFLWFRVSATPSCGKACRRWVSQNIGGVVGVCVCVSVFLQGGCSYYRERASGRHLLVAT